MARMDEAVRRVLNTKAALGLFDDPYRGTDPVREKAVVGSREHVELSREAGRKSVVLLKNDNGLLPLKKSQKIALVGPFADDVDNVWGPWTIWGAPERRVSLEAGFRAAMSDPQNLTLARGSGVETPLDGGIEQAIAAARDAEVIVLAIGEATNMSGEAQSRTDISSSGGTVFFAGALSLVLSFMLCFLDRAAGRAGFRRCATAARYRLPPRIHSVCGWWRCSGRSRPPGRKCRR